MNKETRKLLEKAEAVILRAENMCMASDGPVAQTITEMSDDDITEIYKSIHQALELSEQQPEVSYTLCSRCNEKPAAICLSCLTDCTEPKQQPKAGQPLRKQPCGCILCICETEDRCLGCGAKMCEKHKAIGHLPPEDMVYQQQPLASEFTKDCRRILRRCEHPRRLMAERMGSQIWSNVIWKRLDKACDIIDSLESSKADLLRYARHDPDCHKISRISVDNECTCGFEAAIAKAKG